VQLLELCNQPEASIHRKYALLIARIYARLLAEYRAGQLKMNPPSSTTGQFKGRVAFAELLSGGSWEFLKQLSRSLDKADEMISEAELSMLSTIFPTEASPSKVLCKKRKKDKKRKIQFFFI
jgi:hypothetical protein